MNAENVRSILRWYNETRFDINSKYAYKELEELERLARIGKVTETVFENGGWIQIPLNHDIDTIKDLLEWAESEGE